MKTPSPFRFAHQQPACAGLSAGTIKQSRFHLSMWEPPSGVCGEGSSQRQEQQPLRPPRPSWGRHGQNTAEGLSEQNPKPHGILLLLLQCPPSVPAASMLSPGLWGMTGNLNTSPRFSEAQNAWAGRCQETKGPREAPWSSGECPQPESERCVRSMACLTPDASWGPLGHPGPGRSCHLHVSILN